MIAEDGPQGVTMREIGRRVGVSRAAPYRHFPDKASLLVAVASAGFERLHARLAEVHADDPDASVERFRRLGEVYVRFALENPAHYRLMYGRDALLRQELPELREAANTLFEELVGVIARYQESGAIRADEPRTIAYITWGAVHGLASLLIDGQIQATVDIDALIRATTDAMLDGLRASDLS